jgi:hypothetical protein
VASRLVESTKALDSPIGTCRDILYTIKPPDGSGPLYLGWRLVSRIFWRSEVIKTIIAFVLMADGLTTAIWEPGFLRWLRDRFPYPVPPVPGWFLRWPGGCCFERGV